MMMDASRGDFKSTAEKRKKQAQKFLNEKPAKQKKKLEKKEDREFYSEQRKIGRDRKKSKRKIDSERASRKRQGHRKNTRIENKKKRKDRCKGTTSGTRKCPSARKRKL